jgi:hypothetical protein
MQPPGTSKLAGKHIQVGQSGRASLGHLKKGARKGVNDPSKMTPPVRLTKSSDGIIQFSSEGKQA